MSTLTAKQFSKEELESTQPCGYCTTTADLKIDNPICGRYQVMCDCGIRGPLKGTRQDAIWSWDIMWS